MMRPSIVFSKLQTMKSTYCSHNTFKNEIIENISTHCGNRGTFLRILTCTYTYMCGYQVMRQNLVLTGGQCFQRVRMSLVLLSRVFIPLKTKQNLNPYSENRIHLFKAFTVYKIKVCIFNPKFNMNINCRSIASL